MPPVDPLNPAQAALVAKALAASRVESPAHSVRPMATDNPKRIMFGAPGPGGVRGIVVPKHMWDGNPGENIAGMKQINKARAEVYGPEHRDPLNVAKIEAVHREVLRSHFAKPLPAQLADEKVALQRLRDAKHISQKADTLDTSEKLDTVHHEHDGQGRTYEAYAAKGIAGHSLYTSGSGAHARHHIVNTCPGQTAGCSGGVSPEGIVDTSKGTCFAPNAESQYVNASIRRACHEQAKHDPAMTKDWILAHTGSLRSAAARADKQNKRTLFRPNVVDETDRSSRHVIAGLNRQRAEMGKPPIIANSYGKTSELHDPENGYYVTHSNVGPKVKGGAEIAENIHRDGQRVQSTVLAADTHGRDFVNENGNKTPPKNSYLVTDVPRDSPLDAKMRRSIKYAKYWSAGREANKLKPDELAEPPEAHYGFTAAGKRALTTPEFAHYGHVTINGKRYDYQKQHVLHPRYVQVGVNDDGSPHMIPTDSRFKDNEFLPARRYRTRNGKAAGAILMTTPTTSTSKAGHHTSFTHHVDDNHIAWARANHGEYEIDPPAEQEAARGKPYVAPKRVKYAHGGAAQEAAGGHEGGELDLSTPELSNAAQEHLAHRGDGIDEPLQTPANDDPHVLRALKLVV